MEIGVQDIILALLTSALFLFALGMADAFHAVSEIRKNKETIGYMLQILENHKTVYYNTSIGSEEINPKNEIRKQNDKIIENREEFDKTWKEVWVAFILTFISVLSPLTGHVTISESAVFFIMTFLVIIAIAIVYIGWIMDEVKSYIDQNIGTINLDTYLKENKIIK
jgi:hypothetical protein